MQPALCGTRSGYNKHLKLKEKTCGPCRLASRLHVAEYAKKNRDKVRESNKVAREKYRAKPETKLKRREYAQKSAKTEEGADRILRNIHARRARKMLAPTEKYTLRQIILVYGTICHICSGKVDVNAPRDTRHVGWEQGLHLDHVIPIAQGGGDTIENVRPAHGLCNIKKGGR